MPSREQWPYDPYPLVVITRPGSKARAVESRPIAEGGRGIRLRLSEVNQPAVIRE